MEAVIASSTTSSSGETSNRSSKNCGATLAPAPITSPSRSSASGHASPRCRSGASWRQLYCLKSRFLILRTGATDMRIVVVGGTGHIGTFLIPRLVRAEHEVLNISRGGRAAYTQAAEWQQVQHVIADREH